MPVAPQEVTAINELSFLVPEFPIRQIDDIAAIPECALPEPEFGDEPTEFLVV